MSKHDDDLQEIRNEISELKTHNAVKENDEKWYRTICRTSVMACGSFLLWLGTITYDKFPAFKAAIVAFLQADKGQP